MRLLVKIFLYPPPSTTSGYSFGYPQFDLTQGGSAPFSFDPQLSDYEGLFADILLSAKSGEKYIFDPTVTTDRTLENCPDASATYDSAAGDLKAFSVSLAK